ncbi:zinc ribbon domain-containing protein [Tepidanaerobacter syntrophicus]|uniref:Zinc-ribbon family protein n=1 Tax=Tepidanaerobacter syntrophicus TaxID=224999 RepID=A0A0U9HFG1_9FIRM|nr:zinc ribbon domain-containing protein [Tepidanaerobacter syntrophicus]GAQ25561.1 zinc-ribbon family protein [Tepidanaerobacter syntrophicus]GLI49981.1 zinc ribbon domain-containing protein [Tepidanaerobacter syntrophicus]HHV83114.1 zinc ribbon domain-containing protein [Tepidanaerobacter syntrophicus]
MFFFGIFGIQQKERTIKEFDNVICPECGKLTRAELWESFTYFHFFFIPIFKWNRQYYIKLRCCGAIFMVDPDYAKELKRDGEIDFNRLKKIKIPKNICPNCGSFINPSFAYCPFCGQKLL